LYAALVIDVASFSRTIAMGFCHISHDVKLAAIQLHELNLLPLEYILQSVGFSESTFYQILRLWQDMGDVVTPMKTRLGKPRLLNHDDIQYLLTLVCNNPDYFLDELINLLKTNRFISIHFSTIHCELERAGMSQKRLKKIALERNEDNRANFVIHVSQYTRCQLGFLDETSKDKRTPHQRFGRSKKGTCAQVDQEFVQGRCVSTKEALLSIDEIIAHTVFEGSMTQAMFLDWMEFDVVSMCLWL
jgi:transposase